jgi:hypothetical protein
MTYQEVKAAHIAAMQGLSAAAKLGLMDETEACNHMSVLTSLLLDWRNVYGNESAREVEYTNGRAMLNAVNAWRRGTHPLMSVD